MSALQALRFGIQVASYSDRHENEPLQMMTPLNFSGSFEDLDALAEFADCCDLITLENEFIDSEILRQVEQQTGRSEEHTSELQSRGHLVCRLLLEKKKKR